MTSRSRTLGAPLWQRTILSLFAIACVMGLGLTHASAEPFAFEKGNLAVDFPDDFDVEIFEDPTYGDIVVYGNDLVLGSVVAVEAAQLDLAIAEVANVLTTWATDIESAGEVVEGQRQWHSGVDDGWYGDDAAGVGRDAAH